MKLVSDYGEEIFERAGVVYFSQGGRFYSYGSGQMAEITGDGYIKKKYGVENRFWKRPFGEFVRLENRDFITAFYQEEGLRLHRPDGTVRRRVKGIGSPWGMGVYGMALDGYGKLWIAVPVEHYVGRFDLHSGEVLFSIGGEGLEPGFFDHPEHVMVMGDYVYVSDMGNKRIVKVHVLTHEWSDWRRFDEPIYYLGYVEGKYVYQLESGIYIE